MDQLMLSGTDGGRLADFILSQLDDDTLDEVSVTRQFADASGTTNEPITVCALLTAAGTSIVTIARLIERWMELHATDRQMNLVLEAYGHSEAAGKALGDIAKLGLKVTERRQPMDPTKLGSPKTARR